MPVIDGPFCRWCDRRDVDREALVGHVVSEHPSDAYLVLTRDYRYVDCRGMPGHERCVGACRRPADALKRAGGEG